jgi:hypothetical protein
MIPGEVVHPRLETRLNLLARKILVLLGEHGSVDLDGLGAVLDVPGDFAALAVGWLARSRVIELIEAASGKLQVSLRRPVE